MSLGFQLGLPLSVIVLEYCVSWICKSQNETRVEVPEQIIAEQRCFRDFIKFSADQRCFRTVKHWFSLNQHFSALDQTELENRRKCFLKVREGIKITENKWFWSVPAMEKSLPAKILSKIRIGALALFLMLLDRT